MKLVSYRGPSDAGLRGGILLDDQILDLTRGFARHEAAEGRPATAVDIVKKYGHGVLGFVEHEAVARPPRRRSSRRTLPGRSRASTSCGRPT